MQKNVETDEVDRIGEPHTRRSTTTESEHHRATSELLEDFVPGIFAALSVFHMNGT